MDKSYVEGRIQEYKSNTIVVILIACAIIAFGLYLMFKCISFTPSVTDPRLWGFILGFLFGAVGSVHIVYNSSQEIEVDTIVKELSITNSSSFKETSVSIPFRDISNLEVSAFGIKKYGALRYYLTLTLKDGKMLKLFSGTWYSGMGGLAYAQEVCDEIKKLMGKV